MNPTVTYKVAPNIAIIKYWGKADTELHHPLFPSLSFTLDSRDLCTITQLTVIPDSTQENEFILNNEQTPIPKRMARLLQMFRNEKCTKISENSQQKDNNSCQNSFRIESSNNFPTASGLASSSSAYAALALCLGDLFSLSLERVKELARLGSGSATRSCEGGLNEWQLQGVGQNVPSTVDEDLSILIMVYSNKQKEVGSTEGMQRSVAGDGASRWIQERLNRVGKDLETMKGFIQEKKYNEMCELIMRDSNALHSICMDTFPPIFYLNEFSFGIIDLVHKINDLSEVKMAYTFDAGPHAVLIIPNSILQDVFQLFHKIFELSNDDYNQNGKSFLQSSYEFKNKRFESLLSYKYNKKPAYIIKTKIGNGPEKL